MQYADYPKEYRESWTTPIHQLTARDPSSTRIVAVSLCHTGYMMNRGFPVFSSSGLQPFSSKPAISQTLPPQLFPSALLQSGTNRMKRFGGRGVLVVVCKTLSNAYPGKRKKMITKWRGRSIIACGPYPHEDPPYRG